ncbi:acyltransferase [Photobacterium sp. ZSDE20]|uniref:Acyltransferase n=1 Tax=Photobacterium pectinilyticum TaxID=2906793 RepID=A0ABT1N0W1_9GAMM|nr:acyltransferase [Photobacterium sp. ZSDE20]MCQ1058345.1 acyltransferase [Photobacterium sp. ZSDE20]MDD1823140.1 acyltransferase [Photobacterium sp. ZSDE20]
MMSNHYKSLDGLRGLAALIVVFSHFSSDTGFLNGEFKFLGQIGVMLFFLLSGFLMMLVTDKKEPTIKNIKVFYIRRVSRVYPLFLITILFSLIYQITLRSYGFGGNLLAYNYIGSVDSAVKNLLFIRGDEVFWTIGLEIFFYLIFPVFWFAKKESKYFFYSLCIFFLAFQYLTKYEWYRDLSFLRLNQHLHFFIFGMLTYEFNNKVKYWRINWDIVALMCVLMMIVSLPYYFNILTGSDLLYNYKAMWTNNYIAILFMPLLVIASIESTVFKSILEVKSLVFLGTISYSLYLLHRFPLRSFLFIDFGSDLHKISVFVFVMLPISILLSYLSFKFIENPSRKHLNYKLIGQ